jgi:hypothetical protein
VKHLLVTAAALSIAVGGAAFAQSTTTTAEGGSDMWMQMTCNEFMEASESDQREIVDAITADGGAMKGGSAAAIDSQTAVNSGADVSQGTRGTNESATAQMTADRGDDVSVSDVASACESSPASRVSEVVDEQMMQ